MSRLHALRTLAVVALTAGFLAACDKQPPPAPVVVTVEAPAPIVAAECWSADPGWIEIPDADVRRSEGARNYAWNKERFADLRSARRICRKSLAAQFPTAGGSAPDPPVTASRPSAGE